MFFIFIFIVTLVYGIVCCYIYFQLLKNKKYYIKLNENDIEIAIPFLKKKLLWEEIADVYLFLYNDGKENVIGIVLKEDYKKLKGKFNMLKEPAVSFRIPGAFNKELDIDKLYYTILKMGKYLDK